MKTYPTMNIAEARGDVVPISQRIKKLQMDIDALEWNGDFQKADFLKKLLDEAETMRDNGSTYYPLF